MGGSDVTGMFAPSKKIVDREDEYHHGRLRQRQLSPERSDPFAAPGQVGSKRTYRDIMEDHNL